MLFGIDDGALRIQKRHSNALALNSIQLKFTCLSIKVKAFPLWLWCTYSKQLCVIYCHWKHSLVSLNPQMISFQLPNLQECRVKFKRWQDWTLFENPSFEVLLVWLSHSLILKLWWFKLCATFWCRSRLELLRTVAPQRYEINMVLPSIHQKNQRSIKQKNQFHNDKIFFLSSQIH